MKNPTRLIKTKTYNIQIRYELRQTKKKKMNFLAVMGSNFFVFVFLPLLSAEEIGTKGSCG